MLILKKSFLAVALLAVVGLGHAATSSKVFTFTNSGNGPMTLSNKRLTGTGAANYSISGDTCTSSVASGGNCSMTVAFTPTAGVSYPAALEYDTNATNGAGVIPLSGTGQAVVALPVEVKTVSSYLPPQTLCGSQPFYGDTLLIRSTGASFTINKIVVSAAGLPLLASTGALTGGTVITSSLPASVSTTGYSWGGLTVTGSQYLEIRAHACAAPRTPLPLSIQITTSTGVIETWAGTWGPRVANPGTTVYWTKQ